MTSAEISAALVAERRFHDRCRDALAAMVEGADEQVVIGENASASGADAEVLGYQLRSKAKELKELPQVPAFFGRLDFGAGGEHAGQSYHVGRLRITEHPAAPPLVVDWRAPVSRAFYQAGANDPQGVDVRRRFGWAPGSKGDSRDLTGLEDERLGRGEGGAASAILAGEIERPRVGPMRDIAATIQPEQDDLVRAALADSVCVQGAPGTGKTAVGLHRAAYLLYTFPRRIQRGGLLVLGPNRTFLSYISAVLPALGENGVRQSTVAELVGRFPVRSYDDEPAATLKHDPRMAEVLRRALYGRVSTAAITGSLAVKDDAAWWRVSESVLEGIVRAVRSEEPPYLVGRERVRSRVVRHLQEQAERRGAVVGRAWQQRMERARPVREFLDAVWPKVRPEEVVHQLLTDGAELAGAADGVFDSDEQQALLWDRPPRSYKSAQWSAADLVLIDEAAGLLDHPEGYGHIVVDEAQDLSPMQARAIARRAVFGSLTVLGDLAQGTTPWAARDWGEQLGHLGKPEAAVVPLTVGFRVPEAVVELANQVLGRLDVSVPPARSLRRDGELRVRRVDDVVAGAVDAVRRALGFEGSVGVIAAEADVARVRDGLVAAGVEAAGADELGARVAVVAAGEVKGLEYDHVVAVEPAAVVEGEARGLERLYVVLTRAVSRLDVVHARELPFGGARS
ncbi:AAA family ATPase [Streptomyces sp. VRA16 Mangrove soil]|uniref:HelD family protein n=1 Tax=Streptomyces sp. VRA16 Mangrove soil TaxID=2817434 RepID=UPI001A9FBE79|nr:AAA family ATPase [Streptomyces sp. VRA16 Mangrove soil]MBO1337485.1 AAA family ATPase [Streptomyces sp. VRA16 Mangrove soil]